MPTHILTPYLKKFDQALEDNKKEEALRHLHKMLQRDPCDQKGLIKRSLRDLLSHFPSDETESQDSLQKYDELRTKFQMSDDQLQQEFGDSLQGFEQAPNEWTITTIKMLAEQLIERGRLDKADYNIPMFDSADTKKSSQKEYTTQQPPSCEEEPNVHPSGDAPKEGGLEEIKSGVKDIGGGLYKGLPKIFKGVCHYVTSDSKKDKQG